MDDYEDVMSIAAEYGHCEILRLCKEYGAVRFDNAVTKAAQHNHIDILKIIREWKVRVYVDDAIESVAYHDVDDEIRDFLIEWNSSI